MFKQGPVPAFVHGIVAYSAAILFIAAPFLFDFKKHAATAVSVIVGVVMLIIGASTEWRTTCRPRRRSAGPTPGWRTT